MSKQYRICFILFSYFNLLNAASISMKSFSSLTVKPSTLVLPPGFDSQLAPLQPMLYPFAVSLSEEPMRPPVKTLPIITPGWIPMPSHSQRDLPLMPASYTSTSTSSPMPLPASGDSISQYEAPPSSLSVNDGPVFESIVYGTWKPDPPLQPATTTQQQQYSGVTSKSGLVIDGKVYNKTINRQHGGFIGHIPQKPTKNDRQNILKNNNEKSLSTSSVEYTRRSGESAELNIEHKQRKIKKQGRQKIRPNITIQQQQSSIESSTSTEQTTTESQQMVIKVNTGDPQLMEVVKQINDSIEIKYNHKQTSPHSIEMMMTTTDNEHEQRHTNVTATVATSLTEHEQENNDEFENTSVTRMNWPTDFMNTPLTSTSATNPQQSNEKDSSATSSSASIETESSELPLALSALNIPPSLWPKLPGNITKFGSPYEAENSAEESALCVPITIREENMINSNEFVHIERIFCFPMPNTTSRDGLNDTTSSTLSTVSKAKVQSFDDFLDINVGNSSYNIKSQLYLLIYILVIHLKFIY